MAAGSGQILNGNGEGFALAAVVAIVADFAVAPASDDHCRSSGSPFLGTRCTRLRVVIPIRGTPRTAQAVFHSFGWGLKIRPLKVGNPPRAISQGGNAHPPPIVPARDKLPKVLSQPSAAGSGGTTFSSAVACWHAHAFYRRPKPFSRHGGSCRL